MAMYMALVLLGLSVDAIQFHILSDATTPSTLAFILILPSLDVMVMH